MTNSERQTSATGRRSFGSLRISPWVPPLVLISIAVVLVLVQDVPDLMSLAFAGISSLIALVGAIQSVTQGLRPVAASFYIFWFSWLGIGPIAQMSIGRVAWGDSTILADEGGIQLALAMTALAISAFWIGDRFAGNRTAVTARPLAGPAVIRPWVQSLLSLALIGVGFNAIRVLGLSTFFVARNERAIALSRSGNSLDDVGGVAFALYTVLPSALSIAVLLLAIYRIQLRWRGLGGLRFLDIAHLALGVGGVLLFANWISQSRFVVLLAFGSAAIALLKARSRRAGITFLTVGLFGTLLIYPLANVFRYANTTVRDVTTTTFTGADFDGFQQVVNTMKYVAANGHTWGNELLSAVFFFVPRSIWHSKAEPAAEVIATHAGYVFTNLSLPIHAELYLQFDWVGVLVLMLALGFASSRFDTAWLTAPLSKMAMLAPPIAMAVFGILRGPLGAQVPAWLPVVLFMALAIKSAPRVSADMDATLPAQRSAYTVRSRNRS